MNYEVPTFTKVSDTYNPVPDGWDTIPGELSLGKWTYTNCRSENNDTNVGCVVNGSAATTDFYCMEAGVYEIAWTWSYAKTGDLKITVTDINTDAVEVEQTWAIADGAQTVKLEGLISKGRKHISFNFTGGDGYLGNYTTPSFTKVADEYSPVPDGWDTIPGELSLTKWNYSNCQTENNGANVGYVVNGANANVNFYCTEQGVYEMAWTWSYAKTGDVAIVIKDLNTDAVEVEQTWAIADGNQTLTLEGLITEGKKNISFTITGGEGFLGNYTAPSFTKVADEYNGPGVPSGWDVIPGSLALDKWTYGGGCRTENGNTNVGWVVDGSWATDNFYCKEDGVYALDIDFYWFNAACDFTVTITDEESGDKEIEYTYTIENAHHPELVLPGLITKGRKAIRFDLTSTNGGFLVNWKTPEFKKVGESFAAVKGITVAGNSVTAGEVEGYDFAFTIPVDYNDQNVTFIPEVISATISMTASGDAAVTDNGDGTYSIPTPAPNAETIVTVTLNADEGAYKDKEQYTVRFFRVGGVILSGVNIDSFGLDAATVEALNNDEDVTVSDYIFTALPEVTATFLDGSQATATSKLEGTKATYTFTGKAGDKEKTFTLAVDGIHIYTATDSDKSADLRYDSAYKQSDNTWSNGLYTIDPVNDGWGGTQFKFSHNNGQKFTLTCPNDMKVNQLVFASLFDNYVDGKITSVTSGDATVWLPSASTFVKGGPGYNLVINVENHVAGTPFEVEFEGGSQPVMWFEFLYETAVPTDAPTLLKSSTTDLTGKNHTVVSFTFNREVEATEVEFNGSTATSHVTGTTLNFPLWDLEYETEYTLVLPAGAVIDKYGNKNTEDLSVTFTTGKEDYVESHDTGRFISVSTVAELRAAVARLSSTNNTPESPTTVIYIANGDYDFGSDVVNGNSPDNSDACLVLNKVYNVSLIGQSQDGVLIHSERTGLTHPTLSTRDATNIYMENFTVRNDLDFDKDPRIGVGVAHYGGQLDIMKNVTLKSIQDTQVTGERGYYYNVTIYGTVDFICGGGDHFYDHCTIVNIGSGSAMMAPSTSPANKHGYVFSNCTIKGDGGYYLGRPWQGEPRCYWINTTMEALPNPAGWNSMGTLPTHFYEYNSMDADGNPLDLSARRNSPTSTNTYTPVLTAEEAAYFTHHNVVGYTDSWDPTELTAECEAPAVSYSPTGLSWEPVAGAAGYLIYIDGAASHFTTDTHYDFATSGPAAVMARAASTRMYKVAAISASGSHGALSEEIGEDGTTGIESIGADARQAEYYNLQGQRVANPSTGVYIMRQGDTVKKVVINN